MPPLPCASPGYQFCTVEYLICALSSATSSTTAAWSWFLSRMGAVRMLRHRLGERGEDDARLGELLLEGRGDRDAVEDGIHRDAREPLLLLERDAELLECLEQLGIDLLEALRPLPLRLGRRVID